MKPAMFVDRPGSWKMSYPEHTFTCRLLSHFSMHVSADPVRATETTAFGDKKQIWTPLAELEILGWLAAAFHD
jgi:hypothetical protein